MAVPSKLSPTNKSPIACPLCNKIIGRRADLPRHMRLHDTGKESLMFRCPYEDCSYKNLQKSNVDTHIRTHTGEKTQCCPDCQFTTCDPGSLTRHRKRLHGYDPKSRRGASEGKVVTPKRSTRHTPYSRDHSKTVSASSSATPPPHYSTQDLTCPTSCEPILPPSKSPPSTKLQFPTHGIPHAPTLYDDHSFAWNKTLFPDDTNTLLPLKPTTPDIIPRTPSPKQLFPAVDAGALEDSELSKLWEISPNFIFHPFTDFLSSAPPPQNNAPNWFTGPTSDYSPPHHYRTDVEIFNPKPQYASVPYNQAPWSLSEYTMPDVSDVTVPPPPPSDDPLFVNWDQLYNPPSPVDIFSPPSSSYDSSPSSSPFSDKFPLPPLTSQEFEQFILTCSA